MPRRNRRPSHRMATVLCVAVVSIVGCGCKHKHLGGGPVQQTTSVDARSQGPDVSPVWGGRSDIPWTVTEVLDEEKRPLLDRCRELRSEFLRQADRSCESASDCLATNGCAAANKRSIELVGDFERRWLSLGCSATPPCKNARLYCDRRVCEY
jgi:hypothetical protein